MSSKYLTLALVAGVLNLIHNAELRAQATNECDTASRRDPTSAFSVSLSLQAKRELFHSYYRDYEIANFDSNEDKAKSIQKTILQTDWSGMNILYECFNRPGRLTSIDPDCLSFVTKKAEILDYLENEIHRVVIKRFDEFGIHLQISNLFEASLNLTWNKTELKRLQLLSESWLHKIEYDREIDHFGAISTRMQLGNLSEDILEKWGKLYWPENKRSIVESIYESKHISEEEMRKLKYILKSRCREYLTKGTVRGLPAEEMKIRLAEHCDFDVPLKKH